MSNVTTETKEMEMDVIKIVNFNLASHALLQSQVNAL